MNSVNIGTYIFMNCMDAKKYEDTCKQKVIIDAALRVQNFRRISGNHLPTDLFTSELPMYF